MITHSRTLRTFVSLIWMTVAMLAPVSVTAADGEVNRGLPTVELTIGAHKVVAEVVRTPEQRAIGLMNRFSLQPDHGMLFVFERAEPLGFWMKNTYIPLSIAFIDESHRILNIEDMAPQTEDTHWSRGRALYALEMRKGWFREHAVAPGTRVEGIAPSKEKPSRK